MTEHRAVEDRVKKALGNPAYFAETYFRPYDPNWNEVMPPFGVEMLVFMATARRGTVMLPPEFMKTTLGQCYLLWRIARASYFKEMLRAMLASEEEGMAKANLSVITWHIENNERLAHDFRADDGGPLLRPDPTVNVWRDDSIVVLRQGTSRDPTVQAKGLDSKGVQGRRLDLLLADDLITPRNAESPALRKRALDLWDLQFETRLVGEFPRTFPPRGQALAMGNFNDARDLLSTLGKRHGWTHFKRPSIHLAGQPDKAPQTDKQWVGAVLTWPQVWPLERLQQERRAKPQRFRRIHLLDSRAEGGTKLQVAWMRIVQPVQVPVRYAKFYVALDDAVGGDSDEDLDYANVTVGALYRDNLFIIESIDTRRPLGHRIDLVFNVVERYSRLGTGVMAVGAAKTAMDRYLKEAILVKYPQLTGKLVEISIPGDKETRLQALGPYAQSGWLQCTEGTWDGLTSDHHDQWQELTLHEQWQHFPFGTHDDKLDGLDILVRTAREFGDVGEDTEYELVVAE